MLPSSTSIVRSILYFPTNLLVSPPLRYLLRQPSGALQDSPDRTRPGVMGRWLITYRSSRNDFRRTSICSAAGYRDPGGRGWPYLPHLYEQRVSPVGAAAAYATPLVDLVRRQSKRTASRYRLVTDRKRWRRMCGSVSDSELTNEFLRLGVGALKIIRDAPADYVLRPAILHHVIVVRMAGDFVRHDFRCVRPAADLNARKPRCSVRFDQMDSVGFQQSVKHVRFKRAHSVLTHRGCGLVRVALFDHLFIPYDLLA